jgi:hypothetical protein
MTATPKVSVKLPPAQSMISFGIDTIAVREAVNGLIWRRFVMLAALVGGATPALERFMC